MAEIGVPQSPAQVRSPKTKRVGKVYVPVGSNPGQSLRKCEDGFSAASQDRSDLRNAERTNMSGMTLRSNALACSIADLRLQNVYRKG